MIAGGMRFAALLAALLTCLPPQVRAQSPASPPAWDSAACPFLKDLDLARFEPKALPAEAVSRGDDLIRRARINLTPPRQFAAGRVVVVEFQGRARAPAVLAAFRSADGQWLLRASGPNISLRTGRVMPQDLSRRLNEAVANPCLFSEPAVAPRGWPIRTGERRICADGADTMINLDLPPAEPRRLFHECATRGAAGALHRLLDEAAFGSSD